MIWQISKFLISAALVTFASWLSGKKPGLAGFIIALPLATLLALAFGNAEYDNPEKSIEFAKSIFYAVPLTLLFFVPFLFAAKLRMPFWGLYSTGIVLLALGYVLHAALVK